MFNTTKLHKGDEIHIETFDSGIGGFLTAKAIEKVSQDLMRRYDIKIKISHFGDTKNAPYGEKTSEEIALLTSGHILKALDRGADMVFIACNTASTQYDTIQRYVKEKYPRRSQDVISIIDISAQTVKEKIDPLLDISEAVSFAILATPATVKSNIYSQALQKLYGGTLDYGTLHSIPSEGGKGANNLLGEITLHLEANKKIHIYKMAPANWVTLIEKNGGGEEIKKTIRHDIHSLESLIPEAVTLDGVGELCTHYPIFHSIISETMKKVKPNAFFIQQAPLMAEAIFKQTIEARLNGVQRESSLEDKALLDHLYAFSKPNITISGDQESVEITKKLVRFLYPNEPEISVVQSQ